MEKVLVSIYNYYGKGQGEELNSQEVIEDTIENREALLDDWGFSIDKDFINKVTNDVYEELDGGDWDDPTGRSIIIESKEEVLKVLEEEHNKKCEFIEELFNKSVQK